MSEKIGKWTKDNRHRIWDNYVHLLINNFYNNEEINSCDDLTQEALCPTKNCGTTIKKSDFYEITGNDVNGWLIHHLDGNENNNNLDNLVPMHPWCQRELQKTK